ncbi:hypothetical protein [Thermococcus sp. Bubb.Bath]|uniref:hypothetical protein n=1 Tax=Thermococcus sp. Bubb.Bath TaxID=1638242 RepID=UPI001438A99B|nr:hypothetical protein [Thermococcus sp. Bubb.Bath]NJF24745.1 hypothetical protein [Thermococcus sp. Bubb.Bath]
MVIKYEPINRREEIARLFRDAIEAENRRELDAAKKKLDKIMELAREEEPELYFEACFRLGEIFLQEDNYRGAIKCALRAIYYAPTDDLFRLGFKRLGNMLFLIKEAGKKKELAENMDTMRVLLKEDENLGSFLDALVKVANGEEVEVEFPVEEMNEALQLFKG